MDKNIQLYINEMELNLPTTIELIRQTERVWNNISIRIR